MTTTAPHSKKTFLGHPIGLFVLFFTEMWERFSYYGMRALLILYMTDYLFQLAGTGQQIVGFCTLKACLEAVFGPLAIQPLASQIYGLYTGLVYLTPFFGGLLADRLLGQRKTVVLGAVLMAVGHFLMAIEPLFFIALFFLILGNGCFKPNISTQVGSLYEPGDPRRDSAFSIFYMGINLGAFFSPLVCGTLGKYMGWHYGFGAAGVGMLIGLFVYLWGQKYLAPDNLMRKKILTHQEETTLTSTEWKAIWGLCGLCLLNVVFWGVYEQQGNTLQLFAEHHTDWRIFGKEMPSTWFQSFNPFFVIVLTPLLNIFWRRQARGGKEPSTVAKMALGCIILGLSFLVLMAGTQGMGEAQRISCCWLVLCIFVCTIGELYLSPIGLSLVSKVAPVRLVSMMMGIWFLSSFLGNYLSGYLGTYYEVFSKDQFFLMLALFALGAGIAMFALKKPLKKAIGEEV